MIRSFVIIYIPGALFLQSVLGLVRDYIMYLTNVVCSANIGCMIDLRRLCYSISDVRYDPRRFPGLIWQHRKIGGNCLVFSSGVINCNGKATSFEEGFKRLRRYARRLQKLGLKVELKDVKCITVSASHALSADLNLELLAKERPSIYEPELFPTVNFKTRGVTFSCFRSGKIVITGIKRKSQIDDVVYPVFIELELYTR